jgi:hypothetical protein
MRKIKNDSKSKNKGMPASPLTLVFGFVAGCAVMGLMLALISTAIPEPIDESQIVETITIPFDKIETTYSQYAYQDRVTLVIAGTGQAAGSDFSDAFYQFTQHGQPLAQPLLGQFDLEIDGQRAIDTLGLRENPPTYTRSHRYTVTYNVGETPRSIAFRISDSIVDDNSGTFTIQILIPAQ